MPRRLSLVILTLGFAGACASSQAGKGPVSSGPSTPDNLPDRHLSEAFNRPKPIASSTTLKNADDPSSSRTKLRAREIASGLALVQSHLRAEGYDAAGAELRRVAGFLDSATPAEQQTFWELTFRLDMARGNVPNAHAHALRWLLSCGPKQVDVCRRRAFLSLQLASRDGDFKQKLLSIRQSDDCLLKAEAGIRRGRSIPACIEGAAKLYKQMTDRLMTARVALARGWYAAAVSKNSTAALQSFELADGSCSEPRCATIRMQALRQAHKLYLAKGDPVGAARSAMHEMALAADSAAEGEKLYQRPEEVDKLCEQIDAKDGPGACRRLEKHTLGRYFFRDFSRQRSSTDGLSKATVKQVGEHFEVLLDDCLAQQAHRLQPPAFETYTVHWLVLNNGRVDQVNVEPKTQEAGPLGQCAREQFVHWRYPRYRGEFQHVEQRFSIKAAARTTSTVGRPYYLAVLHHEVGIFQAFDTL